MPDSTSKSFGEITFASTDEAQQFLNSVLSAVQHPLIILSNELSVMGANPAFYEHFEVDVQDIVGHRIYDLGNGQWNIPELRHLFEQVLTEDRIVSGFRVDHDFEQLGRRVFLVNASRFHRPDGEISIVLGLRDNTEFEFEREYSEKIVDALRDPFLVLGWDLRVKSANQPFYSKFRVDPSETEGRLIFELGNGQWDIPRLRELLERILPEESTFDAFEVEHDFEGIGPRAMLLNARRINHLRLILLVIEDVTDKKRAEAQQQVLLRESQHRVKNLLMNVRALSELTVQSATSLENFAESFEGRLQAMGRTQDLLVRDPGDRAQFDQIIRLELEAIGGDEASNFTLQGPALELSARASHAFAMTVHELATNAAKYGAFSHRAANGRIDVTWSLGPVEGKKVRLHFRWREHGLIIPANRTRRGFGTEIIENSVPYLFGGSSTLSFYADGIECLINAALPQQEVTTERVNRA